MMKQKQVFNNAKWIIGCKILQSLMQLAIGMVSARYLGPSNYGLINYAASIVAFAMPLMKLGLDAILVHELVESPEKEGEIMGTSLLMNCLSGIICMGGVALFASIVNFGETVTIVVCVLYSISVFFAALEMIQYWFQYKLLSKYSSLIMLGSYVFVSAYKIYLLATGKSVYWFALSHSVEYGFIAFFLLIFYGKKGGQAFRVSWKRAKKMLAKSKHYILAALMIIVIQHTDHIMITKMVGTAQNGYYSAAITTAGMAQFVFTAIMDSFRPLILSNKKENQSNYEINVSRLYGIVSYLALAQSLVFTIFAPLIIGILYGQDYQPAIGILQIITWQCSFAYIGTIRNIWLLAEGKQKHLPFINLSGVVANILLNALMIPFWGACGAAFASLLTQIFMNFVFGFVYKPVKENNRLMLQGLHPIRFVKDAKQMILVLLKKQ